MSLWACDALSKKNQFFIFSGSRLAIPQPKCSILLSVLKVVISPKNMKNKLIIGNMMTKMVRVRSWIGFRKSIKILNLILSL
jgi:hypothetical protein